MLPDLFQSEWAGIHTHTSVHIAGIVQQTTQQNANALATAFYDTMLKDKQAQHFLSHDQVKSRLHNSMVGWLHQLFGANAPEHGEAVYAHQIKIGEVHARIDIPVSLVLKGARTLKDYFAILLDADAGVGVDERLKAYRQFSGKVDLAMEVMSQAYASSHERKARSSEAYRLFSITENIATEKEKQKAALLDWESKLMFEAALGNSSEALPRVRESEFGLWFRHKGMHAFQGVPEVDVITDAMDTIDTACLPLLGEPSEPADTRSERIRELRQHAKNIKFQLENLFARSLEVEAGKDVLTHLLNRKFLPTVLTREIDFCRKQEKSFAVAAIDIDYFKQINDSHGHESGDLIIQQVATLLNNTCRGGDFLFRMGGEEFLMVLVDMTADRAKRFAERVRLAVQNHSFLLQNNISVPVTVSVGLAVYSGHPDYNYVLRQADKALYRAKHEGRNRVCVDAL